MEKHLVALGKRIAYLRNKKGYTQEKLAELVSYSTNHIGKLESARTNPSFELFNMLSDQNFEVNKSAEDCIKDFYDEIESGFDTLSYDVEVKILEILIEKSQINHQKTKLTAFKWILLLSISSVYVCFHHTNDRIVYLCKK